MSNSIDTLSRELFENKLSIKLPLKHDEVYRFTYCPDYPGPVAIEIQASPSSSKREKPEHQHLQVAIQEFLSYARQLYGIVCQLDVPQHRLDSTERTLVHIPDISREQLSADNLNEFGSTTEPESDSEIAAVITNIKRRKLTKPEACG